MTGGRLRRVSHLVRDEEAFCFTYGDGVTDLDISATIAFHKRHAKSATVVGVHPPGRFGALEIANNRVVSFKEKPQGDGAMINGGFFVLSPKVLTLLRDDATIWEQEPMQQLTGTGELMCFEHNGFWQPMDTLRDKTLLENLWNSGQAPWKKWN